MTVSLRRRGWSGQLPALVDPNPHSQAMPRSASLLTLVLALVLAPPGAAQETGGMASGGDHQPMVLRAARMLDVTTGEVVQNATLVVERGRITGVNPGTVSRWTA